MMMFVVICCMKHGRMADVTAGAEECNVANQSRAQKQRGIEHSALVCALKMTLIVVGLPRMIESIASADTCRHL